MKKFYLLLIAFACTMGAYAQKEIYGEYSGTILTIRYNEYREQRGGVTEWWSSQYSSQRAQVKTVLFDGSMNDARPTSTAGWFGGFTNLQEIVGMENLNTINTTDMSGMFYECNNLRSIDLSHMKVDYVRDMSGMFLSCEALTELDLYSFRLAFLQNTDAMFAGCINLERIYSEINWELYAEDLTSSADMFYNCPKLKGGKGTVYDADYTDIRYAHPDKGYTYRGYFWVYGDTGFAEGIESIQPSAVSTQKTIQNGQLLIERNGKKYNAQGTEIK